MSLRSAQQTLTAIWSHTTDSFSLFAKGERHNTAHARIVHSRCREKDTETKGSLNRISAALLIAVGRIPKSAHQRARPQISSHHHPHLLRVRIRPRRFVRRRRSRRSRPRGSAHEAFVIRSHELAD